MTDDVACSLCAHPMPHARPMDCIRLLAGDRSLLLTQRNQLLGNLFIVLDVAEGKLAGSESSRSALSKARQLGASLLAERQGQ
jgi:hypothetical protein